MSGHLLIALDSKIPNLAIMKLSAWLKSRGETVWLDSPGGIVAEVWISCVFTWNARRARSVARLWEASGAVVHVGGTGVDFMQDANLRLRKVGDSHLPEEAEWMPPDYTLYDDDRAVGFVARGCNRRCEFCVVPFKEGRIGKMWPIREWSQGRSKILLLDNDLPLGPHHDAVLQECLDNGFKLSITQGYDIRCVARGDVTDAGLELLADVRPWDNDFRTHRLYIAWDYFGIEGYVRKGIDRLIAHGIPARDIMCYILCGFNTMHEQDLYRLRVLQSYGVMAFVMRYNLRRDDPWLNAFARYVNRGYERERFHIPIEKYRGGILVRQLEDRVPLAVHPAPDEHAAVDARTDRPSRGGGDEHA